MPDIQAHLADGTTLHFPDGTDPNVIQGVVKKQIGTSANPYSEAGALARPPVAPLPKQDMQTVATPTGEAKNFGQGLLDIPRSVPAMGEALAYPEKSIGEPMSNYWQQTKQQFGQGNPSWLANLVNTITAPTMIPQSAQGFAQTAMDNPSRAAGQAAGMYAAGKIPEVPEMVRTGAQDTLGVGKNFVKSGAEKVGEENVSTIGKHEQATQDALAGQKAKIDQARISEPQAFADAEAKYQKQKQTVQQANAESQAGFGQRQQHLSIADQHAQSIADKLPTVYDEARKEASAAYGPQPKGTLDPTELKTAIQDMASSKLQGNTKLPTAVSKIVSDIDKPPEPTLLDQASVFRGAGKAMRGGGVQNASDAISVMEPKARARYLESLSPEERLQVEQPAKPEEKTTPLDAQRIHGFMSELGRASRSGSLSADEVSSINATRTMLEGRLRKLYENEGRLGDFQNGQAKWKQMANTFENTASPAKGGSPVAQALATKDPVTGKLRPDYVQAALTGEKSFPVAKELLGRYTHLGAPTSELDVMKTHGDFADTLPSQVKWKQAPESPKYPNFTEFGNLPKTPAEPPTLAEYDPIEARKVALKQKAASLSGTGGPYGVMRDVMGMKGALTGNPMALSYPILRRILGSGVGGEKLTNWLSQATPEELNMAKEIPAKAVALRKKNP